MKIPRLQRITQVKEEIIEVIEAIRTRRSVRGYKPDPVPKKVLEEIIDACQWAGSPGNMQPWEFAIIGGDKLEEYKKYLVAKTEARAPVELEFKSTLDVPELYDRRRTTFYKENVERYLYPPGTENVEQKKLAHVTKGSRFFDAPGAIMIYMDKALIDIPWIIMSLGIMAQTVCLAALSYGLGTCIMGRPTDYPDKLRNLLGVPRSKVFMCGIAIGYPDPDYKVNTVPRIRIPKEEWVHWHGF